MSTVTKKGKFVGNPEKSEFLTTYKSEDSGLVFGTAVEVGTDDDQATEMTTGSDVNSMLGIAVEANEKIGIDDLRDYDQYDTMKIGQKGTFYVEVVESVSKGNPVGLGLNNSGAYFGTASSYTEIDAQFFDTAASGGTEVKVEFNLPM